MLREEGDYLHSFKIYSIQWKKYPSLLSSLYGKKCGSLKNSLITRVKGEGPWKTVIVIFNEELVINAVNNQFFEGFASLDFSPNKHVIDCWHKLISLILFSISDLWPSAAC